MLKNTPGKCFFIVLFYICNVKKSLEIYGYHKIKNFTGRDSALGQKRSPRVSAGTTLDDSRKSCASATANSSPVINESIRGCTVFNTQLIRLFRLAGWNC